MLTTFALAAALAGQFPGSPGVVGGPLPIPPGATPAQVQQIQARNRALDGRAYAASAAITGANRMVDTAPRVDFAPMGGAFITPSRVGPQILGIDPRPRYVSPFGPAVMFAPQSRRFVGPPTFRRCNPIGMGGRPN